MDAPGSTALVDHINDWTQDGDGNYDIVEDAVTITEDADSRAHWLDATWDMIEATLTNWTIVDLTETYRHTWNGRNPLVLQLRFTRSEFILAVRGIKDADALKRFMPMNCISWNIGHMASTRVAGAQIVHQAAVQQGAAADPPTSGPWQFTWS
jgi:hypothetical protein